MLTLKYVCVFALLIAVQPAVCRAQTPSNQPLQEAFQTELVYPQERGELQLTTGLTSAWNDSSRLHWPLQVEYGLTDSWQVQFESDGWQRRAQSEQPTVSGWADVSFGTKYSFMNIRGSHLHAALAFSLGIPFGSIKSGLGDGFLHYEPSVMLARDFPLLRNLQLFSQVGVSLVQRVRGRLDSTENEPAAHQLQWSGGFFKPFRHLVVTSELSWETNRWSHHGQDNELYVTPGTTWKLRGGWEFGVAVSAGLTSESDSVILQMKLTREFQSRAE
jgi:hypothetical protein